MSETKTLKIFEPLKTYFNILCHSGNCDDFSSEKCKELIIFLTTTYENRGDECTENFINALKWFAYELKKADSPIGVYTIKGKLKEIFTRSEKFEDIEKNVNSKSAELNYFNMDLDNGEKQTYKQILQYLIDSGKYTTPEELFKDWIDKSFSLYEENKKYFNEEIKPNLVNLDNCQKRILNDYFEIVVGDSIVSVNDYISKMEKDYDGKEARLNIQIQNGRAKIINLLPETMRYAFNSFLIIQPGVNPEFEYNNGCYEFVPTKDEPIKETYKVPDSNIEKILGWFANISSEINKNHYEKEEEDKPDNQPYEQDDVKLMFPDDFEVIRYDNKWGLDKNGKLYKRDGDEYKLYPEDKLKADAESFKEKDGKTTCGKLCIFDEPTECDNFFEKLIKGDELSMNELSEIINNANFVSSYESLKNNIAEVNPLFVIGTLKLFGFQKYTQIDIDGSKIVKIESFTNWWNRQNQKKGFEIKDNSFGSHNNTIPGAPANVELFFKLLINFINSNEFVLNPKDKKLMTKSGLKPSITTYKKQPKEITWTDASGNKHTYKNIFYKDEISSKNKLNIDELESLMKINSSFTRNPFGSNMSDNILNMSTLLGLMTQMTTGGKFSFLGKAHSHLSGLGYVGGGVGYVRGGGEDDIKTLTSSYGPYSGKITKIYNEGKNSLKKNNKIFDEDRTIYHKIKTLASLESALVKDLDKLASVVKIINILGDNKEEVINSSTLDKLILKCGREAEKCSKKSDFLMIRILEKLGITTGETSYFSKL